MSVVQKKKIIMRAADSRAAGHTYYKTCCFPLCTISSVLIVEQKIYLLLLKMLVQFHVLWTFLLKNKRTTVVGFF